MYNCVHATAGVNRSYNAYQLICVRQSIMGRPENRVAPQTFAQIREQGILRTRGSRGGTRKSRHIKTLTTNNRRPQLTAKPARPASSLIQVNISDHRDLTTNNRNESFPGLYVINANSIAKMHAIDQLRADLIGYSLDIAIITETHLKAHHSDPMVGLSGYSLIRRDRVARERGGVAVAVKEGLPTRGVCIDGGHEISGAAMGKG